MPRKALIISQFIGQTILNLNPRIETKLYNIDNFKEAVCINLMIQVSHIQGHEIRIISYALLDGGDCLSH